VVALALAGVVIWLHVVPADAGGFVRRTLFDAGHGPAFGLFALAVLILLESLTTRRDSPLVYGAAFVVAGGFGLLTEALQFIGPRNADLTDLGHNLHGAAAALLLAAGLRRMRRQPLSAVALTIAGLLLVWSTTGPAIRLGIALARRNVEFPQLVDFSDLPSPLITVRAAAVEPGTLPGGEAAARVTFRSAHYPALILELPYPDWTDYDTLAFDVYSDLDDPVELHVRVDDTRHNPGGDEDRYFDHFRIAPGAERVRIPLSTVRSGPRDREMEMRRVKLFMIYLVGPTEPRTLTIGPVRLERRGGS
jgi:hypothetical protein